jgi:hypothetical protein
LLAAYLAAGWKGWLEWRMSRPEFAVEGKIMPSDPHPEETIRQLQAEMKKLRTENELYRKALLQLLPQREEEMTEEQWQELQHNSIQFAQAIAAIENEEMGLQQPFEFTPEEIQELKEKGVSLREVVDELAPAEES